MNPNPGPNPPDLGPLEHLLSALNSTPPPVGMEQRIFHAIERRRSESLVPNSRRVTWLHPVRLKPELAFTLAVSLFVLCIGALLRPHTKVNLHQPAVATTKKPKAPMLVESAPQPSPSEHRRLLTRTVPLLPSRPAAGLAPPAGASTPAQTSFPAPPMALTGQEKLLLRLAHRSDPHTLDALSSEERAAEQAQERSDFETFFPAPQPAEYPALLVSQVNQPEPLTTPLSGAKK